MPVLSIIVPVFNKEKYIEASIESILTQSFTDFELILINDGSKDNSGSKCDYYDSIDSRVKVIHQDNKGVSAARNLGLSISTGEYIGFVDSDDTIEYDMYETLIRNAELHTADISICGIRIVNLNNTTKNYITKDELKIFDKDEGISAIFTGLADWSANNKIYRSVLAKNICFKGRINEDLLYTFSVFMKAEKIVYTESPKYIYMKRESSISLTNFSSYQMESIQVSKKILSITEMSSQKHINEARQLDFSANLSLLNMILISSKKKYQKEYNIIVNNLEEYLNIFKTMTTITHKQRYAYLVFMFSPILYNILLHIYCYFFESEVGKKRKLLDNNYTTFINL